MFVYSCAYAYVTVIPSQNNIRKTSVFVLFMLRAYVYVYVAAVLTSVNASAYALVNTSL